MRAINRLAGAESCGSENAECEPEATANEVATGTSGPSDWLDLLEGVDIDDHGNRRSFGSSEHLLFGKTIRARRPPNRTV
jgi:hypothetical protein